MKLLLSVSILFVLIVCVAQPAFTQKAKKDEKPKQTTESTSNGSLREALSKHVDRGSNLGTIKRVTGEYVVFEHEGATVMHPLHAIHTVKTYKDEESGADILEIRLMAAD